MGKDKVSKKDGSAKKAKKSVMVAKTPPPAAKVMKSDKSSEKKKEKATAKAVVPTPGKKKSKKAKASVPPPPASSSEEDSPEEEPVQVGLHCNEVIAGGGLFGVSCLHRHARGPRGAPGRDQKHQPLPCSASFFQGRHSGSVCVVSPATRKFVHCNSCCPVHHLQLGFFTGSYTHTTCHYRQTLLL